MKPERKIHSLSICYKLSPRLINKTTGSLKLHSVLHLQRCRICRCGNVVMLEVVVCLVHDDVGIIGVLGAAPEGQ